MDIGEARAKARAWREADPDPATAWELDQLLDSARDAELVDRFGSSLEFGTAGLRGLIGAGTNRMNRAVVRRTTAGLAAYLKETVPGAARRGVVVARDGRRMSREFAEEAASVLVAAGVPALVFPEVAPTPLAAFATLHLGAAAGIMITASHNPPEYNGYKVYWENGAQIIPPHDQGIARQIELAEGANRIPVLFADRARAEGLWRDLPETVGRAYLDAIDGLRLYRRAPRRLGVVYTAMHGVGARWVEAAMAKAGVQVRPVAEQREPDGAFPTVRFPNPEEPGAMDRAFALAEECGADLVLANDPDADRLAVAVRDAEQRLRMLTGNEVGVLLGHYLLTQTTERGGRPLVISTIVSSSQLSEIARALGAEYAETLTGFKWIANRAIELERQGSRFVFGYEEALGYTVGAVVRDKDGVGAGLVFADLAAWCESQGMTVWEYLERIRRRHGLFVATQRNYTFPGTEGADTISRIMAAFRKSPPRSMGKEEVVCARDYLRQEEVTSQGAKPLRLPASNVIAYELGEGSRITLRPSGTEPKIKYYFELRETLAEGEPMGPARHRAEARLEALARTFLEIARQRGHPSE